MKYILNRSDYVLVRYSKNESQITDIDKMLSISKELQNPFSITILYESLNILHNELLDSLGTVEKDIYQTFQLPVDDFSDKMNLDKLDDNIEFINSLSSLGLKKSDIKSSTDFENFLKIPCQFMFIYNIGSSELENPVFIIFETWDESKNDWNPCKLYEIKGNVDNFYRKLSSRTIEIKLDGSKYIYKTSNGNEWELQNSNQSNDVFKKTLRKEDLEKIVKDNKNIKIESTTA